MKILIILSTIVVAIFTTSCNSIFPNYQLVATNLKSYSVESARVKFANGTQWQWGNLGPRNSGSVYPWKDKVTGGATFEWRDNGEDKSAFVDIPDNRGDQVNFELHPSDKVTVQFGKK